MSKGAGGDIAEADLNILGPSSDEHVRCGEGRHGGLVDLPGHLEVGDDLRCVGVPHIDVVVVRAGHEQASVDRVPNRRRDRELVTALAVLVHHEQALVLRQRPAAFARRRALDVVHRRRGVRSSRQQISPLRQIDLKNTTK